MKLGIVVNPQKKEVFPDVRKLLQWLQEQGSSICYEENSPLAGEKDSQLTIREMVEECEIIVVFGGDGTLLHVSNRLAGDEIPLLGVNAGRLGFLTETTLEGARETFRDVLEGKYRVQERMMLKGEVENLVSEPLYALNDLVLSRARHGRVIQVSVRIDGDFVSNFICDGLIVSTPTGSTAYNLSASGPIVHPGVENIVINPICPHTLTNRPLIVPAASEISLRVEAEEECILTADGQEKITNLHRGNQAVITRASFSTRLIVPRNLNFYEILRTKLQWSGETPETG
ncbi:MAG: NAD(+)/NADH kinase [bacterium]